jgi:hypothetical protein
MIANYDINDAIVTIVTFTQVHNLGLCLVECIPHVSDSVACFLEVIVVFCRHNGPINWSISGEGLVASLWLNSETYSERDLAGTPFRNTCSVSQLCTL